MASSSWSWKAVRSVLPFSRVRHTTPSRRITTRSQKEAAKESWVTMKMVASRDALACSKDRITARLDLLSRFPVGSSARISRGWLMRGPGHGTALLLAAGDLRRVLTADVADAEYVAQLVGPLLHLGVHGPTDDGGQQDVLPDGEAVQQQEILEHEAQLLVADLGQSVLPQVGQLRLAQGDLSAVGGDVAGDAVLRGWSCREPEGPMTATNSPFSTWRDTPLSTS